MKRIALVVQRCHESIVGGSEALAWQYATLLSPQYSVDVLTTTALDYITWADALPSGCEAKQNSIRICRFPVTIARSQYWSGLHERLLKEFHSPKHHWLENSRRIAWTIALQEEFIRHQGPYSEELNAYLGKHWQDYQVVIFLTYLYPTTYFGVAQVPPSRVLIAPTLHDEPPAYLSAYRHMIHKARSLVWLTNAERQLGHQLWGEVPGDVVSMAIDTHPRTPDKAKYPYLLYCGRIDPSKGCQDLVNFFIQFKKNHPSNLRLVLTGQEHMHLPTHKDVEFRGFVSVEEKFQLMAGATLFVMPSPYESFSIVTLEAMAQGTPVLANGVCQVLVEHVTRSGAGELYEDYQSFATSLQKLLTNPAQLNEMSTLAKQYVLSNYTPDSVRNCLTKSVEKCLQRQSVELS